MIRQHMLQNAHNAIRGVELVIFWIDPQNVMVVSTVGKAILCDFEGIHGRETEEHLTSECVHIVLNSILAYVELLP